MSTCKDCAHWKPFREKYPHAWTGERDHGGFCRGDVFMEDVGMDAPFPRDRVVYEYREGGEFWIGPDFGCIHFVKRVE